MITNVPNSLAIAPEECLVNFQAMCIRYTMRYYAYMLLLVDRYPSFEEPTAETSPPQTAQPAV